MQKKQYEKPEIRDLSRNRRIVVCEIDDHLVSLPVAREIERASNAIAGFFFREAPISFNANRIEHGCPMVLWAFPGIPMLHWIARVQPFDGAVPRGSLRLVTNPNQPGAMQGGLSSLANSSHVNLNSLGPPDEFGGWSVGGHLGVSAHGEGMLAVRIQGICQNTRIVWSAISQAHPE